MLSVRATRLDSDDPLAGLMVGEAPEPTAVPGWEIVHLRAAAINRHDLAALQGRALGADRLPAILGSDGAGTTDSGRPVIVHALIFGEDGLAPEGDLKAPVSLLSEHHDGTHALRVAVPSDNLVDKPDELSFVEAACLPTSWLTAFEMLVEGQFSGGDTLLVQGAGGGVATAAVVLGRAMGFTMWVTSRSEEKRRRAVETGADAAFEVGSRLPERVDGVIETVGAATWRHSLRAVRRHGTIVVAGATTGSDPGAELRRISSKRLRIVGASVGSRDRLQRLVRMLMISGARPVIDRVLPLHRAQEGYARLLAGNGFGKVVLEMPHGRSTGT